MDDDLELDYERFIYEEVRTLGGDVFHMKVGCHHRNVEPIKNVLTGHEVARLCLDCDTQLPVIRKPW